MLMFEYGMNVFDPVTLLGVKSKVDFVQSLRSNAKLKEKRS